MPLHGRRQAIVGRGGECHCLGRAELLGAGRGQRQDLNIDSRSVHSSDPAVAKIAQLLDEQLIARRHLRMLANRICQGRELAPGPVHERRCGVVLFDRDRPHFLTSLTVAVQPR